MRLRRARTTISSFENILDQRGEPAAPNVEAIVRLSAPGAITLVLPRAINSWPKMNQAARLPRGLMAVRARGLGQRSRCGQVPRLRGAARQDREAMTEVG